MKPAIHVHRWNPPAGSVERPCGIYLLHGTGEHAGRYHELATRLASNGWRVGAHDHPGHGLSTGKRGLIDPAGSLATQAAIQFQAFAIETGATPLLFGHSLGGVLATELVVAHHLPVTGLMLSAPALVPVMNTANSLKLKALSLVAPTLCLNLGYDPSLLTHDVEIQQKASADPLIHGFKSTTLVNWLMQSGQNCMDRADELSVETLLMIAGGDLIIDSSKTRLFASRVPETHLSVHEYEGFYHELLNETPERRERVLLDIERWLERFHEAPAY